VYYLTEELLRNGDFDVATARELGHSQSSDATLLELAKTEGRILITRDRDFGNLVFVGKMDAGVIYLRVVPDTINPVHAELLHVLSQYSFTDLSSAFVVVEPDRHRFRKINP
jgi:predicted nuclease of predicted toxin-antitoxin system